MSDPDDEDYIDEPIDEEEEEDEDAPYLGEDRGEELDFSDRLVRRW